MHRRFSIPDRDFWLSQTWSRGGASAALFVLACLLAYFYRPTGEIRVQPEIGMLRLDAFRPTSVLSVYPSPNSGDFTFQFRVHRTFSLSERWRLYVDDCVRSIRINGTPGDLSGNSNLCGTQNAVVMKNSLPLDAGSNSVELVTHNEGGPQSILVETSSFLAKGYAAVLYGLLAGAIWILLGYLPLVAGLGRVQLAILYFATVCILFCFQVTPFYLRGYDVAGHLDYVLKILDGELLPRGDACWECYHPPLYYWAAALFAQATFFVPGPVEVRLQLFSVLLYCAFLACSAALFNRVMAPEKSAGRIKSPSRESLLFTALIGFWPGGFIQAVRISNEALFYPVALFAVLCFLIWWEDESPSALLNTAIAVGVACLTKATGLLLLPMVLVGFFARQHSSVGIRAAFGSKNRRRYFLPAFVLFAGLALTLSILIFKGNLVSRIGNVNSNLLLQNIFSHLLLVDFDSMVKTPFPNPWNDISGRQYFWNYLIKSSLWGEFESGNATLVWIAAMINFGALALFGFAVLGWLRASTLKCAERAPLYLISGLSLGALFGFRVYYALSTDFRFVYFCLPVLFCFSYFGIKNIDEKQWLPLKALALLAPLVVTVFSLAYFLAFAFFW